MAGLPNFLKVILPKKKANDKGTGNTGSFDPSNSGQVLTLPQYNDHRTDIFTSRQADNSNDLLKSLFKQDPDVSASVNAYLTAANQEPIFTVRDLEGNIDREGMVLLDQTLLYLTRQFDYSLGFRYKPSLKTIAENMRYMMLLRGGIMAELVLDKSLGPKEIRHIDTLSIRWIEKVPGEYKPFQDTGEGDPKSLDFPTIFCSFFRRDPTEIYTHSFFVSSVNTIAARQQVINDLYRIMRVTGFPRIDLTIVEEVLKNNAPANIQQNTEELKKWMAARLSEVSNTFATLRSDQAFAHFDSVEIKTVNDGKPGASLNIEDVIQTLNSQNQAALKTMGTVIGRGESGVNTASVEARIFAMNADELNEPIAELLEQILTLSLRIQGYEGYVDCIFKKVELRPELELEPQLTMRQSRLLTDLSNGLISDNEYHMMMYNRLAPDGTPELSGTGFVDPVKIGVDETKTSPNGDPLGRGLAPEGSKSAKSNSVKNKK